MAYLVTGSPFWSYSGVTSIVGLPAHLHCRLANMARMILSCSGTTLEITEPADCIQYALFGLRIGIAQVQAVYSFEYSCALLTKKHAFPSNLRGSHCR